MQAGWRDCKIDLSMSDDLPSSTDKSGKAGWWSRLIHGGRRGYRESRCCGFLGIAGGETCWPVRNTHVQGVLKVSETQVRDIMVPRSHMVVLELDDPPATLLDTIINSGHSRFPVIGEDRDEVVGILLAKDLLKHVAEGKRAMPLR
ncbi:MAG: hypothetical protein CM1200mP36_01560 [Gammaproteobacteria bacterium]|nr:MAG: hypothetical protein CM1200mP36_01560 [Gammaproteobacteria bacterium]